MDDGSDDKSEILLSHKAKPRESTEDKDPGCTAYRHDLPEMQSFPDWKIYVVTQSAAMKKRGETFDTTPIADNDSFDSYLRRITSDENLRLSTFRRIESDKAVKREFQALGMLIYPPSFQNTTAKTSLETFEYLLRFEHNGNMTDLFEIDEELHAARAGDGPVELLEDLKSMDVAKQACFEGLNNMPGHIKFIPGVAAAGKSYFLVT
jgi:hypothetical protein